MLFYRLDDFRTVYLMHSLAESQLDILLVFVTCAEIDVIDPEEAPEALFRAIPIR